MPQPRGPQLLRRSSWTCVCPFLASSLALLVLWCGAVGVVVLLVVQVVPLAPRLDAEDAIDDELVERIIAVSAIRKFRWIE